MLDEHGPPAPVEPGWCGNHGLGGRIAGLSAVGVCDNVLGAEAADLVRVAAVVTYEADATLFAGKGDEELVSAVGASDPGEAVAKVSTLEECVDGPVDDRAPVAELPSISFGVDAS